MRVTWSQTKTNTTKTNTFYKFPKNNITAVLQKSDVHFLTFHIVMLTPLTGPKRYNVLQCHKLNWSHKKCSGNFDTRVYCDVEMNKADHRGKESLEREGIPGTGYGSLPEALTPSSSNGRKHWLRSWHYRQRFTDCWHSVDGARRAVRHSSKLCGTYSQLSLTPPTLLSMRGK